MDGYLYVKNSTTISLCLSLFDWERYKTTKGAIKMYTLLDYDGNQPAVTGKQICRFSPNKDV
jgi:hypothetical protein